MHTFIVWLITIWCIVDMFMLVITLAPVFLTAISMVGMRQSSIHINPQNMNANQCLLGLRNRRHHFSQLRFDRPKLWNKAHVLPLPHLHGCCGWKRWGMARLFLDVRCAATLGDGQQIDTNWIKLDLSVIYLFTYIRIYLTVLWFRTQCFFPKFRDLSINLWILSHEEGHLNWSKIGVLLIDLAKDVKKRDVLTLQAVAAFCGPQKTTEENLLYSPLTYEHTYHTCLKHEFCLKCSVPFKKKNRSRFVFCQNPPIVCAGPHAGHSLRCL